MSAARVIGGAWIAENGWGMLGDSRGPRFSGASVALPAIQEVLDGPLPKFGRFDVFTKLGFFAAAAALKSARIGPTDAFRRIGTVIAGGDAIAAVDIDFYRTTLEDGGALAGPHLFTYTLPCVVAGEISIHFHLTGPTLSVADEPAKGRGAVALETARRFLEFNQADTMLAGWIADNGALRGAAFVLMAPGNDRHTPRAIVDYFA